MPKKEMVLHDGRCPEEIIQCQASNVGCTFETKRKSMESHTQTCKLLHNNEMLLKIKNLEITCQNHSKLIEQMSRAMIQQGPTSIRFVWKFKGLEEQESDPFYCKGYKFCIRFRKYDSVGTFGFFLKSIVGESDELLDWPLQACFYFQILNQLADQDHIAKREIDTRVEGSWPRPPHEFSRGFKEYIQQNKLISDSTYFRDNCFYLCVHMKLSHLK